MTTPATALSQPMLCSMKDAQDYQASYEIAIRENPANAAITPTYESENTYTSEPSEREPRILVAFNKYWARGRTLKISFLKNPPAPLVQPVIDAARKWLPHINLKFEFVTRGDSDIRLGFNTTLNWSELGTDALLIPQDKPTMEFNFNELYEADLRPRAELERIVLHEFGHALGAVHEHQHPDAKIPWNEPVLRALLTSAGYDEPLIARNFLDQYEAADFKYSAYDKDSIMHFDIPSALTLGDFEVINTGKTLSVGDISFMQSIYPDRENSKFTAP